MKQNKGVLTADSRMRMPFCVYGKQISFGWMKDLSLQNHEEDKQEAKIMCE